MEKEKKRKTVLRVFRESTVGLSVLAANEWAERNAATHHDVALDDNKVAVIFWVDADRTLQD